MRRLWSAGVITVLLLAFCFVSVTAVTRQEAEIVDMLNLAYDAAQQDDFERAYELAVRIEKAWIEAEERLHMFVSHLELTDIGLAISTLPPLIRNEDKAAFSAQVRYSIVRVTHMGNSERLAWRNIF